jgi:hypothetical protein
MAFTVTATITNITVQAPAVVVSVDFLTSAQTLSETFRFDAAATRPQIRQIIRDRRNFLQSAEDQADNLLTMIGEVF